jgi:predicted PurR-regulated permease PerM
MSIYLIAAGMVVKGVVLLIAGSTVIGLVDNLVRPLIIEEKSEGLHLLLVFFSLLGGLLLLGPAGLIIGPLISALLVTFLEIYKIEFEEELS